MAEPKPSAGTRSGHSGRAALVTLAAALFGAAACSRPVPPAPPTPVADPCVVVDGDARARVTLAVARTFDASTLPAQIYQTLVRVDCTGAVVAGLASAWSSSDGRTWELRLAPGTTFHDGSLLDATAVVAAWASTRTPLIASVTATGQYDVRVTLRAPAEARIFALPSLAVAAPEPAAWLAGTGPYVPQGEPQNRTLRLLRRAPAAHAPDTIDVRAFGGDLRTAIDAGVDLLVTSDAGTLAYARARADYAAVPLPWNRTYVLLTSVRADLPPPAIALERLAHDAVRVDARPVMPPLWWRGCAAAPPMERPPPVYSDVVYPRGDDTARELAERITALAWPRDQAHPWVRERLPHGYPPPRVLGLDDEGVIAALRTGRALAVIVPLPRVSHAGCMRGPEEGISDAVATALAAGRTTTPLIDTREHLIHRAGIGRVSVDGDGTIRIGTQ